MLKVLLIFLIFICSSFEARANYEPIEISDEKINLSQSKIEDTRVSSIIFDCISKVYDLEGEFALKVHDNPSDNFNGIKFIDLNRGTNYIKLHPGESFFDLKSLISSSFLQNYNFCKN